MKLTSIDLFCGPGGMTLGLKAAGFKVVAAVEIDGTAARTYEANHPDVWLEQQDVRGVNYPSLMSRLSLKPGQLTLLAACPPCQGYSSIRTRNRGSSVSDPRNDLVFELVRAATALQPLAIMMENVPGLLRDKRLEELLQSLQALGYDIGEGPAILNAADYGVAQSRRRLVLLASKLGAIKPAPPNRSKKRTVRDAIGDLPTPGASGDPVHDLPERRSDEVLQRIRAVPTDGGSRGDLPSTLTLDCHKEFSGFRDVYGRMAWDKPSPTITGGCFNPSKGRFLHPEQDRNITLREAALLQDFPPNYIFSLDRGKSGAAAMIGNALPPGFVEAQARQVADFVSRSMR